MDVALNITRRCNKGCDYCYLDLTGEDLPSGTLQEILGSVEARTVTLTGGEPLLHPDIAEILAFLSGAGKHIHLLSNGMLLSDHLRAIRDSGAELFVSCNGPDPPLLRRLHSANNAGIKVNIHHVLTEASVKTLGSICDDLRFAHSILLLYPTNLGNTEVAMPSPRQWFALLDQALAVTGAHGIKTYFEQAFAKKGSGLAASRPCPTGEDLFIDVDGRAYPCCLSVDQMEGQDSVVPIRMTAETCQFLQSSRLPSTSDYVRICPIVMTDHYDGPFRFPSHLGEQG